MTHEDACRALAAQAKTGALSTLARDPAGYPYASLVAVAFDHAGRPLFCLSRLAEHTQNLEARPEASLLVSDASATGDVLASGRMTLLGRCARVPDAEEAPARAAFLAAHPEASGYASFADFSIYRLEPESVRFIAGFGRMAWIAGDAYARAFRGTT